MQHQMLLDLQQRKTTLESENVPLSPGTLTRVFPCFIDTIFANP